jgi:endonuclease/exonuclease/phosphatase family metal-dependent hydrolase
VGTPRTSPDGVLFTSYNAYDLLLGSSEAARERYPLVVATIRAIGPDVLAVQEVRAPDADTAGRKLQRLARDTGLRCMVPGANGGTSRPALAAGAHGFHVGLAWREGIEPVPGSLRCRNQDFWHALVTVVLDVGGRQVMHASYHAPPFGRGRRADEAELLVAAITRSGPRMPSLVGADWNGESADRVPGPADGEWVLYEPADRYAGVPWFPDMAYQHDLCYDERGRPVHRLDRGAAEVLWAGGLYDAAAVLRAPWQPTTGHFPGDHYGEHGVQRRIDMIRVTPDVTGALRAHWVEDTEQARQASDHLPVSVEYLPAAIGAGAAPGQHGPPGPHAPLAG